MTMAISPAMPPLPADIADDEDAAGSAALDGYADHLRRGAVHAERCVRRLDQALALLDGEPLFPKGETRAAAQQRIAVSIIKLLGH